MFTKRDFNQIDTDYFLVLERSVYHIVLKSKRTSHTWDIYYKPFSGGYSLVVNHKHRDKDIFHVQPHFHPRSISAAQEMIKRHDAWHIKTRVLKM